VFAEITLNNLHQKKFLLKNAANSLVILPCAKIFYKCLVSFLLLTIVSQFLKRKMLVEGVLELKLPVFLLTILPDGFSFSKQFSFLPSL